MTKQHIVALWSCGIPSDSCPGSAQFWHPAFSQYEKLVPAVSSVAKRTLSVREVWGSIPGPVKSAQCRQRLATVATLLRSCVAQALSRGDGSRNSLHASA